VIGSNRIVFTEITAEDERGCSIGLSDIRTTI
jgi:hypothetical protein